MKKAFTMLELVFVIVVVGIISAMIAPSFGGNNLREAADQVISHIRYTQHLAMVDEKFDDANATWFKERWQIKFNNTNGSDNEWAYTIYSDVDQDGAADADEFAKNPLDIMKILSGGWTTILYGNKKISQELNIGHKYGVQNVQFTGGCASGVGELWISFDNQGRPLYRDSQNLTSVYNEGNSNRLIQQDCNITLTNGNENIVIQIEPETGYAHIL